MKYTDHTIPIRCSECEAIEEGIESMVTHIKEDHGTTYKGADALKYAIRWANLAYLQEEEALADYYDDRKLEKSIEADRIFQTHKI